MIKLRTWLFLAVAILMTIPVVMDHFKEVPVCVKDTRLEAPQPPRLMRGTASPPRLLRVQSEGGSPCPTTGSDVLLRVVTFIAALSWTCFFGSLATDIRRYRRRRRKRRRDARRAERQTDDMREKGEARGQNH